MAEKILTIEELKHVVIDDGGSNILILDEARAKIEAGEEFPYTIWGLDVYVHPNSVEEGETFDETRPINYDEFNSQPGFHGATNGPKYFSDRHYEVVDMREGGRLPCSDIAEVIRVLQAERIKGVGEWGNTLLLQEDTDTAYVITPLTKSEMDELMHGPQ